MPSTRRSPNPVVREEMVDERISDLLTRVHHVAESLAPENVDRAMSVDFSELLRRDLREYFEDEIIPAIPSPAGGLIDETELRHEVAKKALIGLKLSALRQGAKDLGVAAGGKSEEVAESIARTLGWDPEAVAQFVLAHEEEPTENHAHSVRIFPMDDDSATPDEIESEIVDYMGRYIRVGVARWYVFSDLTRTDEGVRIFGKYMSYSTGLDQTSERVGITSVRKIDDVSAHVAPRRKVVEVNDVAVKAAKAAVFAATAILRQRTLDYIPHADSGAGRVGGRVHEATEFLLNILENRLPDAGINKINLTVARFKIDHNESGGDDKPVLKAVRFEGNHILDSVQACRFIIDDGRPLVNVAFRLYLDREPIAGQPTPNGQSSFLVKIALETDHVQVTTGLGDDPVLSIKAHDIVHTAVWMEMAHGRSVGALDQLVGRMSERARAAEASDEPMILSKRKFSSVRGPGPFRKAARG